MHDLGPDPIYILAPGHVTTNSNASRGLIATTNIRRVNNMSDSEDFNVGGHSGSEDFQPKAKKVCVSGL
jgi:hypothetical protein